MIIITSAIEIRDYFIEPEEEAGWHFMLADVLDINTELSTMVLDLVAALDENANAEIAAAIVRNFGDKYDDEPDVRSAPDHEVESIVRWHMGLAISLSTLLADEDYGWEDFDLNGREWTDALDEQLTGIRRAVVAHREACADEDCACQLAVMRSPNQ